MFIFEDKKLTDNVIIIFGEMFNQVENRNRTNTDVFLYIMAHRLQLGDEKDIRGFLGDEYDILKKSFAGLGIKLTGKQSQLEKIEGNKHISFLWRFNENCKRQK